MTEKRKGVDEPNYTQTPNTLLDDLMRELAGGEFKIAMCVVRYTFGFHRDRHNLSLSFIEKYTGLSRDTVSDGVQTLMSKGIIDRVPFGRSFAYELIVRKTDSNDIVEKTDQSEKPTDESLKIVPQTVEISDTRNKELKEKQKETEEPAAAADIPPNPDATMHPELLALFEENVCKLTPMQIEAFYGWCDDTTPEQIRYAVKECADNNVRTFAYFESIMLRQTTGKSRKEHQGQAAKQQERKELNAEPAPVIPTPVTDDLTTTWKAALVDLSHSLPPETYRAHFEKDSQLVQISIDGATVQLHPNSPVAWAEKMAKKSVEKALQGATGVYRPVTFVNAREAVTA